MVPALRECLESLAAGETGIVVTHGACLKVGLVGLLGWPTAQATALQGIDNCGWATLAEPPAGRLRLAAYNQTGPTDHRGPISHPPPRLAKIPELPGRKAQGGGAVAQLVAHLHGMEGVRGSSPLSSTRISKQDRVIAVRDTLTAFLIPSRRRTDGTRRSTALMPAACGAAGTSRLRGHVPSQFLRVVPASLDDGTELSAPARSDG